MVIDIDTFYCKKNTNLSKTAKEIVGLLKNNPDKAYCYTDLEVEFKLGYVSIMYAMREVKAILGNEIVFRRIRSEGRKRPIYFAYVPNNELSKIKEELK